MTWQPHLPTTQGKADLQDLQLALPMDVGWFYTTMGDLRAAYVGHHDGNSCFSSEIDITNNDKHAALAQAVIEVAAQVGAKMREGA